MSDLASPTSRRAVVVLRTAAVAGGLMSLTSAVLTISEVGVGFWFTQFDAFIVLLALFYSVLTWLIAPRQPRNGVVWAMASAGFFGGLTELGPVVAFSLYDLDPNLATEWVPATAPSGAAWIVFLTGWTWVLAIMPLLSFGLLLFPDGRLPSRRWRPFGWFVACAIGLFAVIVAWTYRPSSGAVVEEGPAVNVALVIAVLTAVISVSSLFGRLRRSTGDERHQIKWVFWGGSIFVFAFLVLGPILSGSPNLVPLLVLVMTAEAVFLSSYGIALVKYRLYDIDLVISRSFVFAVLALFITVTYALLVVGVGRLVSGAAGGLLLPILATAVVAVAFEPVRLRAQRWANRLVYGNRATPYEVLADLTGRLSGAESGEGLTQRLAELLREGTGAETASVWLGSPGAMSLAASSGGGVVTSQPSLDGVTSLPVSHDGAVVGAIELVKSKGSAFSSEEAALIGDIAGSAGAVLGYHRLNESLAAKAEELERSRARLLGAQDQERRRLERELHEGAEQYIVALKVKLGVAAQLAAKQSAADLQSLLDGLTSEAQAALDDVRALAKGIYPPILESDGLGAAVSTLANATPVEIQFERRSIGRYPAQVEAAVYFDISEAVTNAVKHAVPPIRIELDQLDGQLRFSVIDSGPGFDIEGLDRGSGLSNMVDRLAAVGGTLTIESSVGAATTIRGEIRVREPIPT